MGPIRILNGAAHRRPPAGDHAGGFQYPPLPHRRRPIKAAQFSLPIRIVCGSDEPVPWFRARPQYDSRRYEPGGCPVDTSASERRAGAPFTRANAMAKITLTLSQCLPVGAIVVRLHFAEVSPTDGAGNRIENAYINHRPVLTNFDIFSAASEETTRRW